MTEDEAKTKLVEHHNRMMNGYENWGKPTPEGVDPMDFADECNLGVVYVLDRIKSGVAKREAGLIKFDMKAVLAGHVAHFPTPRSHA